MVTGSKHVALVLAKHGSNGHPPTKRLGTGEYVWLDAREVLVPPHLAGAAHACLHLVHDHQRAGAVADLANALVRGCNRG